ncbi:putative salicylate 1-monooxygenase protein [Eutypa lata UCREL1]|uniref:Putative salicylate 1-monooxygenase protein n=1 Tax=Eutypa lata (strain UCR-EL1) TaxID=1287681 RepID=M7T8U4_EUTLA|nr:putative salicylate 1-monooxygenase protein [Eutypa lata UCREL1]
MTEPLENWTSESWLSTAPVDDLYEHVKGWDGAVQEIIAGLRKGSPDGKILKQTLYVREPTAKWFDVQPSSPGSGIILTGDSVHSTLPHQGQGACQAIESGFALAQTLRNWKGDDDLEAALQFFQDLRKPRTDRITATSYEAGKIASADIPEELWASSFKPEAVRERMKWVMEYDLLGELATKLQGVEGVIDSSGNEANGPDTPASVRVVS